MNETELAARDNDLLDEALASAKTHFEWQALPDGVAIVRKGLYPSLVVDDEAGLSVPEIAYIEGFISNRATPTHLA